MVRNSKTCHATRYTDAHWIAYGANGKHEHSAGQYR